MKEELGSVVPRPVSLPLEAIDEDMKVVGELQQSKLSIFDPAGQLAMDEDFPVIESQSAGAAQGDETFRFKDRSSITSVDYLYTRYNLGYYHRLESLQADFRHLIQTVIDTRCKNQLARDYVNRVLQQAMQHLERKRNDFNTKWRFFFEHKFRENQQIHPHVEGEWYKFPGAKRQYYTIEDYKIVTQADMGKL